MLLLSAENLIRVHKLIAKHVETISIRMNEKMALRIEIMMVKKHF